MRYEKSEENNTEKRIRLLSLFSGCGGMDLGFEGGFNVLSESFPADSPHIESRVSPFLVRLRRTVFEIVFANDILTPAYRTWIHNFKRFGYTDVIFRQESIVDLVKKHKSGTVIFPDNIGIVIGGFPCQDFSVAGKRKGFDSNKDHMGKKVGEIFSEESRGFLYYWMKEVIDITKPNIFIAENVKGLTNLGDVQRIIEQDFASADNEGYFVFPPQVLHAARYGVPQSRERIFFVGVKKKALKPDILKALERKKIPAYLLPYPLPTHSLDSDIGSLLPVVTLHSVFKHLEEPEESKDPSHRHYSKAKFMGRHCQGQKEISLDSIAPTIRSEHHGNIEYRRLTKEHGGIIRTELDLGLKERRLSPRECALIQTFPRDYEIVIPHDGKKRGYHVSPSSAYRLIGNAVPPLLAYHIAKRIEALWDVYFNE